MKTNSGTAISVSLVMMPKMRLGRPDRNACSKPPPMTPPSAKISAVPPSENATGKPASSNNTTLANINSATISISADPAG